MSIIFKPKKQPDLPFMNDANSLKALALVFILFSCAPKKSSLPLTETKEKPSKETFESLTKSSRTIKGLFTFYQDTLTGAVLIQINEDQLSKSYIYFGHTENGIAQTGHFRGNYRDNKIVRIERYYDRIEFIVQNTGYYFDANNAISKSAEANISPAVLVSEKIKLHDKEKKVFLLNAQALFLTEQMHQLKPSPNPSENGNKGFTLGTLSAEKSKYVHIKSYPMNSDIMVDYVFDVPYPTAGAVGVTDARSVTIRYQHSFIELPKNDFVPRRDDPRVGYFSQQREDQTHLGAIPYKDVIHRWHLVKKNPNSPLSAPVEPIVWWIENTTPEPLRPIIEEAALRWNKAFESAGFQDAIQVRIQPDDADWEAGDIRYNVLRWTASPAPPFGGYGPSFVNPETGQILGADIMLEYVFLKNSFHREKLFSESTFTEIGFEPAPQEQVGKHGFTCSAGHRLQMNNLFGHTALMAKDASEFEYEGLRKEALFYLILHELGHTFGLNHNMAATQMWSEEELHDNALTAQVGLMASVMDYPAVNVSHTQGHQGQYYTTTPGPYDMWAIAFGYSPEMDETEAGIKKREAHLSRSAEPVLFFGNDADDMRSPGKAIDPRVMIGDMSNDAIGYAERRVALLRTIQGVLLKKYKKENTGYQELFNAFMSLMGQYSESMNVISRYVGGVYLNRNFQGSGAKPYTPVAEKDQKRAMLALERYLFSPEAFSSQDSLFGFLQRQRRGFNFFSGTEDPKIHDMVWNIQKGVLTHLLHPATLKRLTDSRLYGNTYSANEMVRTLSKAIFDADNKTAVNPFRQQLQWGFLEMLSKIVASENQYDAIAKATAFQQIMAIRDQLKTRPNVNQETKAHTQHLLYLIEKMLS